MIGRTLRQYLVTDKLGHGGMGVVWKARDTILNRDVALKDKESNVDRAIALLERALNEDKTSAPAYAHLSDAYLIDALSDKARVPPR